MCRVKIKGAEEEMKENFKVRLRGHHTPLLIHAAGLLPPPVTTFSSSFQLTAKEPVFEIIAEFKVIVFLKFPKYCSFAKLDVDLCSKAPKVQRTIKVVHAFLFIN